MIAPLLTPIFYFATASHGHGEGHAGGFWDLKLYIINFALYLILAIWLTRKHAPRLWQQRRTSLENAVAGSREKHQAISEQLAAAQTKNASIEDEIRRINQSVSEETEREKADIKKSAVDAVERIKRETNDRIETERKSLETTIRKKFAAAALRIAEAKLRGSVSAESDRAHREKALKNVGSLIQ